MSAQICCDKFKNAVLNNVVVSYYSRWLIRATFYTCVTITNCPWCGKELNPPVVINTGDKKPKLKLVKS